MNQLFKVQDLVTEWQQNSSAFNASYKLFLVILLWLCAISLIYIARKSASEQQKWLSLTMIGFFTILLCYYGEVSAANLDMMFWVIKTGHIAKIVSTLCFLKYTSNYCKVKISPVWMKIYYTYVVVMSMCIIFSDRLPIFYKSYEMKKFQNMSYFSAEYGFMFYLYSFTLCAAIFLVLFMIGKRMIKVNITERKRLRFLFVTGLLPVMGYIVTMLSPLPMLDFVPVTFGISSLLLYIASKQHGLLDVVLSAKENLIENTKEGIVVVDNEYNVLYANLTASRLITHIYDFKQGEEYDYFVSLFQRGQEAREIKGRMYKISVSDIYEKKKVRGKMAWFFDVTETQNYTKEILRLKDEAERANLAKSAFLANMSHEIRTPMNAILGFSELVIQMEKQQNVKDYMYDIKRSAKSLLHIINQILDISKIESGEIEVVEEEFYLQSLLEEVVTICASQASKKGLKCITNFAEDLPSKFYGADGQLREVLINVLNNAVKYTKEGKITLDVYCNYTEEDSTSLCFVVADTGIGMKPEDIDRIYDRFRKFDSMKNQGIEGSGLGMYIVKSLVNSLNGSIGIDSIYGEGTIIKIAIPMKIINMTPMGKLDVRRDDEEKSRRKIIADAKVLVVDDNEINLKLISSLLLRYQIHPDLASSGECAISKLEKENYDLIYMDHMMPEMDGVETMQYIRTMNNGRYKDLPIILLTANAIAGFREEMLAIGFQDYISKPIDIKYLEKSLLKHLPEGSVTILEEESEEDTWNESDQKKLEAMRPVLKHFELEEAMKYCGGHYEDYLEVLRITLEHGDERWLKLKKLFDEKDYQTYTIDVHSLKSIAYNIGAIELGNEAKDQEMAGKNENYKFIEERFEFLMEEYQIVLLEIKKWFYLIKEQEVEEEEQEPEFDPTEVLSEEDRKDLLDSVRELMEAYNIDQAQMVLKEMLPMMEKGEERDHIEEIAKALDSCDVEKAKELLK